MTLSVLTALGLALVVFLLSKKYATGWTRWIGYGVAAILVLNPLEGAINWVRGFLPAFLGA